MSVQILISTTADGSMSTVPDTETVRKNREAFLRAHGMSLKDSVLVRLKYEGDNYRRYLEVTVDDAGDGMNRESTIIADALFTREKNLALFLPLADCIGAVIEDREQGIIGLSHLGRHNLLQDGGRETIRYMIEQFGSRPEDLFVTLSPSAGQENYPLFDFDNRSLQDVAIEQLMSADITREHITPSLIDTTVDEIYFSHSQFLKGNRETDGRFAIAAVQR